MQVVYHICCGIDVHKKFIVATIVSTADNGVLNRITKTFNTFNKNLLEFKTWLLSNNCRQVCMESTGKYWIPIYNLLEDEIEITSANPKYVRAIKGKKDRSERL